MSKKIRIYQLAKELNIPAQKLIELCHELGVDVKTHISAVDEDTALLLKEEVKDRLEPKQKPADQLETQIQTEVQERVEVVTPVKKKVVQLEYFPTLLEVANKFGIRPKEILTKTAELGYPLELNSHLEEYQVRALADIYSIEVEFIPTYIGKIKEIKLEPRAPVVTVMGHVDHGKTSLLDAIRKTNVTESEFGGITQRIGASRVFVDGKEIVFLDTPGHEAFTAMRARGAKVTDIVVLVVSAVDGVMPQTIEAIHHAQAANVPILVAINKMDLPEANPHKVRQELAEYGLVPEEWGGKTIFVEISAKKRTGIDHLLEMLLLEAELLELKANPYQLAIGTVIESKLDKGRGPIGTVIVQQGTLRIGDAFVCGLTYGKVRALFDDKGKSVSNATPAQPVEVVGFNDLPEAGEKFQVVLDEHIAKEISERRKLLKRESEQKTRPKITLEELTSKISKGALKELLLILKADTQGSVEAIQKALEKVSASTKEVELKIIHSGVGNVTESDVLLAYASHAIIIGFNVRAEPKAELRAQSEGVQIRLYRIIYDVIDDVQKAMAGLLEPVMREVFCGKAEIRQLFQIPKTGTVAGCYVLSGKIIRNGKVRIIRDNEIVHEGTIASLRRFKEDVKEVQSGFECGILIENFNDIQVGDIIEVYTIEQVTPELSVTTGK